MHSLGRGAVRGTMAAHPPEAKPHAMIAANQQFFVFVKVGIGQTYDVGRRILAQVPHVREVLSISGRWDLLVKIVIDTREDVGELINQRLAGVGDILDTETIVAYPVYDKGDVYF
jgi:DNA-binding Lrp family transcriptional regulator